MASTIDYLSHARRFTFEPSGTRILVISLAITLLTGVAATIFLSVGAARPTPTASPTPVVTVVKEFVQTIKEVVITATPMPTYTPFPTVTPLRATIANPTYKLLPANTPLSTSTPNPTSTPLPPTATPYVIRQWSEPYYGGLRVVQLWSNGAHSWTPVPTRVPPTATQPPTLTPTPTVNRRPSILPVGQTWEDGGLALTAIQELTGCWAGDCIFAKFELRNRTNISLNFDAYSTHFYIEFNTGERLRVRNDPLIFNDLKPGAAQTFDIFVSMTWNDYKALKRRPDIKSYIIGVDKFSARFDHAIWGPVQIGQ